MHPHIWEQWLIQNLPDQLKLFGEPEYSVACCGYEGFVYFAAMPQPLRTQIPGSLLRGSLLSFE